MPTQRRKILDLKLSRKERAEKLLDLSMESAAESLKKGESSAAFLNVSLALARACGADLAEEKVSKSSRNDDILRSLADIDPALLSSAPYKTGST